MSNSVEIIFKAFVQESQTYASIEEHMLGVIQFSIAGADFEAVIRQPHGSAKGSIENDPIEVEMPKSLNGKVRYGDFRDACEHYYRQIIGRQGTGIRIEGGQYISMHDNIFSTEMKAVVRKPGPNKNAW